MIIIFSDKCPACGKHLKYTDTFQIRCDSVYASHEEDPENDHFLFNSSTEIANNSFTLRTGSIWFNELEFYFDSSDDELVSMFPYVSRQKLLTCQITRSSIHLDELYKICFQYKEDLMFA